MRVATNPTTKIPLLPEEDLRKVHMMCPTCRTADDVFVAFSSRDYWDHITTEHPETITTTTGA